MQNDVIVLCGGARTAMAEYAGTPGGGLFHRVSAIELGKIAMRGALVRAGVIPEQIGHVILGNVLQTSPDAIYGARHAALKAGIPIEVPALTVNRLCGSGIEAIVQAARLVLQGEVEIAVAGGMENLSQAPHVLRGARKGLRFGAGPPLADALYECLQDPFCGLWMAQTAENLAKKYGISRRAQDEYAARSHQLGARSVDEGLFDDEVVPVVVRHEGKERTVLKDDHVRPDTTVEQLARLQPAFGREGTVTAGNASGIVDCAAAFVVTSERKAREYDLDVRGVVRGWTVVGVPPEVMGIGPAPAIRKLLASVDLELDDVDFFEINEAFAAQYLAVEKDLDLDRDKVNVNGGAIALGHPLGATGTRLVLSLVHQLHRSRARYGIASACIGGGQGIAMLIERP